MAAKKESFLDYVTAPFKEWYSYIKDNAVQYYIQLLKIYFLGTFASLALMLLFALVAAGILVAAGGMAVFTDVETAVDTILLPPVLIALGLLFIIAVIVTSWVDNAISLTAVIYTDTEFGKGKFSIMEAFNRIKGKVFRYLVVHFGIWFLIMLPFIILALFIMGGVAALLSQDSESLRTAMIGMLIAMPFGMILFMGYLVLVQLMYSLFAQFWTYGFLLGNLSVMDALGRSVDMVVKKFARVIVFGILLYIGAAAFGAPLMIYNMLFQFVVRVLPYTGLESGLWMLWLFVLIIPIHIIIAGVLTTIVRAFSLPSHYLFWKKVRKDIS